MNKDFIPKDNSWLKIRENGMLLSDYQISVLERNGINYREYASISHILFDINDILSEEDNDDLATVAKELDEKNYYSNYKN